MATITTLKDRVSGGTLYPLTHAKAVFDDSGVDADTRLSTLEKELEKKVTQMDGKGLSTEDYTPEAKARVEALPEQVQGAITPSEDLELTPANRLSLTEQAKRRVFDDLWVAAVRKYGAVDYTHFNEDGTPSPYYLNTLWMTYEEATRILVHYQSPTRYCNYSGVGNIRTNIPPVSGTLQPGPVLMFQACEQLEVANIGNQTYTVEAQAFFGCYKLKRIIGSRITRPTNLSAPESPLLEYIEFSFDGWCLDGSINLSKNPNVELRCYQEAIQNSSKGETGKSRVITVHPDVYAKLTGDTTNAGAAAISPEELQQWMALPELAAQKNIVFATV